MATPARQILVCQSFRVAGDKFAAERRFQLEEQKRQLIFENALTKSINGSSSGANSLLQNALNYGSSTNVGTIPTSLFDFKT